MLLRLEAVSLGRAGAAQLDIAFLVQALGHVVGRQVRNARQRIGQRRLMLLLLGFQRGEAILQRGDFGHQFRGAGLVLLALGNTDFLRQRVAFALHLVEFDLRGTALLVQLDQGLGLRGHAPAGNRPVEGFRIVPDRFDVMHGELPSSGRRRAGFVLFGLLGGGLFLGLPLGAVALDHFHRKDGDFVKQDQWHG